MPRVSPDTRGIVSFHTRSGSTMFITHAALDAVTACARMSLNPVPMRN